MWLYTVKKTWRKHSQHPQRLPRIYQEYENITIFDLYLAISRKQYQIQVSMEDKLVCDLSKVSFPMTLTDSTPMLKISMLFNDKFKYLENGTRYSYISLAD